MKKYFYILCFLSVGLWGNGLMGQESADTLRSKSQFIGQLSLLGHFNPNNAQPTWLGARYLPQLNAEIIWPGEQKLDFEASANISGSMGLPAFNSEFDKDSILTEGLLSPYRIWARYSTKKLELRLGLQKINFGSASMLRPLMWFDQVDPRDPLRLTNGVWGLLGRYYFDNNANIWLWGLYGNEQVKGFEAFESRVEMPEWGGRFQFPVPKGEVGLSYHYRQADSCTLCPVVIGAERIPENRIGLDGKWDLGVGLWFEGAFVHKNLDMTGLPAEFSLFTNRLMLNAGLDYTFGLGNGLTAMMEHLLINSAEKAFDFEQTGNLTAMTLSYPISLFDQVALISYYDWANKGLYNFANWQRTLDLWTFYLIAYWNPQDYQTPIQGGLGNLYAGTGIQIMAVLNH